MNIAHQTLAIVVPEMLPVPPVQGGAVEHWVHEVSKRLDKAKFDITIFSRPANVQGVDGVQYVGIEWTPAEKIFYQLKEKLGRVNPFRYLAKIQNVASYGLRVAKQLQNFDLIVIHNEPNLLLFLQKKQSQKIILHMHNEHLTIRFFRPFYAQALKKVDQVICVSDYIRRTAIQNFPQFSDKFSVVFNATDPQVFKPYGDDGIDQLQSVVNIDKNTVNILYAGRLTPQKGVHVLIEAFRQVHQRLPNIRLIIAGSSFFEGAAKTPYEQSLVELAKPVSNAIIFTGFLPHDKLRYLYSSVDMVVVPSIWQDPCPLVVLESMASATCVVATSVGGIPEVVFHQVDGLLVPPDDIDALVKAIRHVANYPELKVGMGKLAREKMLQRYDWSRLVEEVEWSLKCKDFHSVIANINESAEVLEVTY